MNRESHKNAKRNILSLVSFILLVVISLTFISAVPYLEGNKTVSPNVLYVGDSSTITLTVNGAGSSGSVSIPLDVVLVIDNSCSMCGEKLSQAKIAGKAVVDSLDFVYDRVGLIYFNTNPFVKNSLTNNSVSVINNINTISASGNTNIGEAIKKASEQLSNTNNSRVIVLISDGKANLPANAREYALQQASLAAAKNISIYTIGIGEEFNNVGFNLLKNISSIGNGMYWHYPTVSDPNTMSDIASWLVEDIDNTVLSNVAGSNIIVTDILEQGVIPLSMPADCHYIWDEKRVTCDAGSLNIGEVKTFSFNVFVHNSSLYHLNKIAYVNYTNYLGVNTSFILNNPNVTILTNNTTCVNCNNTCVGNTAPSLIIVSPTNRVYNNSLITVRINASDINLANVWYTLNGMNISYSGNVNVNLSDNVYRLSAYANDSCGSLSSAYIDFRVNTSSNGTVNYTDNIGPNVTIVSPINRVYNTGLILLNITAVDDIAIDRVWYELNGVNYSYSSHYMNLTEGYYTIRAYANDSSGNIDWDGVTFLVNYSNNGTNPGNGTNTTHVHTSSCGHTRAPVNDFDYNETADSVSMDDNFVVALNYVNSSKETTFSMESYLSGKENTLIFNMILLIAIILLLLIIVLVGKKK